MDKICVVEDMCHSLVVVKVSDQTLNTTKHGEFLDDLMNS